MPNISICGRRASDKTNVDEQNDSEYALKSLLFEFFSGRTGTVTESDGSKFVYDSKFIVDKITQQKIVELPGFPEDINLFVASFELGIRLREWRKQGIQPRSHLLYDPLQRSLCKEHGWIAKSVNYLSLLGLGTHASFNKDINEECRLATILDAKNVIYLIKEFPVKYVYIVEAGVRYGMLQPNRMENILLGKSISLENKK